MNRWLPSLTLAASLALSGAASAAAFVAGTDVCLDQFCSDFGASYAGSNNGSAGTVVDGGSDAFDGAGYLFYDDSLLSVVRRTESLAGLNTYRWFDTFTNTTAGQITTTVQFYTNLGSDGTELVSFDNAYLIITRDEVGGGGLNSDPVLALVNGNNAYASTMNAAVTFNAYNSLFDLTLAAGESVSVVHFASLTRPDDIYSNNCYTSLSGGEYCYGQNYYDAVASGTLAAATAAGQSLVNNPFFSGLSAGEIAGIINFNTNPVPAPGSLALLGAALVAAGCARRQRKAAEH